MCVCVCGLHALPYTYSLSSCALRNLPADQPFFFTARAAVQPHLLVGSPIDGGEEAIAIRVQTCSLPPPLSMSPVWLRQLLESYHESLTLGRCSV